MNKFLITIIVPNIETQYEVYIPNNKKIGTIKKNILKSISDLSEGAFSKEDREVRFIDRDTGMEYKSDIYVKDSGIKNGTVLVVI